MFDSCLFVTDKEWGIIIILVNFLGGGGEGVVSLSSVSLGRSFSTFFRLPFGFLGIDEILHWCILGDDLDQ